MIDSQKVQKLLYAALEEQKAFLVDFQITPGNVIQVLVDTLEGISLEGITAISRGIEHNLDREEADFELQVSSPGVGSPLQVREQYQQNIGRDLKVKMEDGSKHEGELVAFENDQLSLQWSERVPKEVGKGKVTVKKDVKLNLQEVKEARVQVRFN